MPMWGIVYSHLGESNTPGVNVDGQQLFREQWPYLMMSAMAFFSEVLTLFMLFALGLFMVSTDTQQGFLLTLLPKPLSRGEYLWGRGLGLTATVCSAWIVMGLSIYVVFVIRRFALHLPEAGEWKILLTTGLLTLKWACIVAILMLGTLRLPPIAGGFWALLLLVGGHISSKVHDIATNTALDGLPRGFAWIGYILIPHFDSAWSAMILDPAYNVFQTTTDVARFIGSAWAYAMVCGLWAWWSFRNRDL
jgi:ABC-type transport system involved in multi-copper enzyme maturation permease subunit